MGRCGPSEFFYVRSARRSRLDTRGLHPRIKLTLGFVASNAVANLKLSDQLLGTPLNLIHIVIGELAPLFANLALQLHPLTLESVFVHRFLLRLSLRREHGSCHATDQHHVVVTWRSACNS